MKWIIAVVILAVAGIAVLILQPPVDLPSTAPVERQRTLKNIKITGTSDVSGIHYTIESEILTEYPDQDFGDLVRPRIMQVQTDGLTREIAADKGRYFKSENRVVLEDNVIVETRSAGAGQPALITTDEYVLDLNRAE